MTTRGRQKILVLDDSPTVLEATEAVLSAGGYDVVTLDSWATLATTLARERPDLALIDVSMPIVSGDALVEVMRRSSSAASSRFVLYSDRPAQQLRTLADSCGAAGFISKTGQSEVLLQQIARFLRPTVTPLPVTSLGGPVAVIAGPSTPHLGGGIHRLGFGADLTLALEATRPSLVLLDLDDPRASQAAHAVRRSAVVAQAPLVGLAAEATPAALSAALEAQVNDLVTVPQLEPTLPLLLARTPRAPAQRVVIADPSPVVRTQLARFAVACGWAATTVGTTHDLDAAVDRGDPGLAAVLADAWLAPHAAALLVRLRRTTASGRVALLTTEAPAPGGAPPSFAKGESPELGGWLLDERARGLVVRDRRRLVALAEVSGPDAPPATGLSTERSPNGVFVTSLRPPKEGQRVALTLAPQPGGPRITVEGEVAWARGFSRADEALRPTGFALQVDPRALEAVPP